MRKYWLVVFIGVILIMVVLLTGCSSYSEEDCGKSELVYKIHYSSRVETKVYRGNICSYTDGSDRGTNYLKVTYYDKEDGVFWEQGGARYTYLEDTSAPIEVVSFTLVK